MIEDVADDVRFRDERDELAAVPASAAAQDVVAEDALEQFGPGVAGIAGGVGEALGSQGPRRGRWDDARAEGGGRGEAHFRGLEPKPHWIALGTGAERLDGYASLKDDRVTIVEFERASAAMHGTVRGSDTEPAAGARVRLGHRASLGIRTTRTASDGTYRIEGLAAGPYYLSISLDGDPYSDPDYFGQPDLEDGQVLRQDFGPNSNNARFTGRVLDRTGEPVRLPESSRPTMTLARRGSGSGAQFGVELDGDGAFGVPLEPGLYSVRLHLGGYWEASTLTEDLEVPDYDLDRDLVLPGVTVRGRLTGGSAQDRSSVLAHPPGVPSLDWSREFASIGGASYAIYGLPPGTWRICARGHTLEEFTTIELSAADTERDLDLELD